MTDYRRSDTTARAHRTDQYLAHHEKYFFNCEINGQQIRAHVDTGCGPVVIREQEAQLQNLKWKPSTLIIKVYATGSAEVLRSTQVNLKVDQIEKAVKVIIALLINKKLL